MDLVYIVKRALGKEKRRIEDMRREDWQDRKLLHEALREFRSDRVITASDLTRVLPLATESIFHVYPEVYKPALVPGHDLPARPLYESILGDFGLAVQEKIRRQKTLHNSPLVLDA